MDASRPIGLTPAATQLAVAQRGYARQRLVAAGGIIGALAASSCCIVPLILFSLGIGGAWVGNLTALAPYKPLFVAGTGGVLGYGFYLVYWKPRRACADSAACARRVADEVIAHLAGQVGAEVTVTLEIGAKLPNGASDQLVRIVTENGRTLKFDRYGFEIE